MSIAQPSFQRTPRTDRIAGIGLWASGLLVFILLAWGHLGWGAWFFPPSPTPLMMTRTTGTATVTLHFAQTPVKAAGPTTLIVTLRKADGYPVSQQSISFTPVMTTMPMRDPTWKATTDAQGRAILHPRFSMAGTWRLEVTLPDGLQCTFPVNVRW